MSYQIQQYIAASIESVLASGQSFVTTANIQKNRDNTTSTVPRYEIVVSNVARASDQMAKSVSSVIVSGAGDSDVNGTYSLSGAQYVKGASYIYQSGGYWIIAVTSGILSFDKYISTQTGANPWGLTYTQTGSPPGALPVPTVSESSFFFYNHFSADSQVSLVTQRDSSTNHASGVSRTRYLFSQEAQAFVSPVVTAFEVLSLESAGEAQDVNEEAREDWSRLNFRFEIGLLASAYVVPTAGP